MNRILLLIISVQISIVSTQGQDSSQAIPGGGEPQEMRAVTARHFRELSHKSELLALKAEDSAEVGRYLDLAENALELLQEALPQALEHYDAVLRGEEGLLYNEQGRFLSQNQEFTEIILRWVLESRLPLDKISSSIDLNSQQVNFGPTERQKRIELLKDAAQKLKLNSGDAFDGATNPSANLVLKNSTWASNAFKLVDGRIALLEGWRDSVPKEVEVGALPTLENEINSLFYRRLSTFESRLNEVEKAAEEKRSQLVAEATANIRETQLQDHLSHMELLFAEHRRLEDAEAQAERQTVSIEADRVLERIKEEHQRELAAAAERAAILERELTLKEVEIDKINGEIQKLTEQAEYAQKSRQLPPNAKSLISILSSKGYWKPVYHANYLNGVFDGDARYPGTDPVPHSLTTISALGALDDTSRGLYMLYVILATKCDPDRPRFEQVYRIDERTKNYINNPARVKILQTEDAEREFTKSQHARKSMEKLKSIQKILRDYGDELVRQGLLAP